MPDSRSRLPFSAPTFVTLVAGRLRGTRTAIAQAMIRGELGSTLERRCVRKTIARLPVLRARDNAIGSRGVANDLSRQPLARRSLPR